MFSKRKLKPKNPLSKKLKNQTKPYPNDPNLT